MEEYDVPKGVPVVIRWRDPKTGKIHEKTWQPPAYDYPDWHDSDADFQSF